jgi:hypothetical protein
VSRVSRVSRAGAKEIAAGVSGRVRGAKLWTEEQPMRDPWQVLVDSVLRPARPQLARCLFERERHVAARAPLDEARARAVAACVAQIESARAQVFAADDGVVGARMTALEREWRRLTRRDPDAGLMDLWARVAPASWIDHKRWRDSDPADRLDAAIALAADVDGVLAAEAAIDELRAALAPWGTPIGATVRWRVGERDAEVARELLARPVAAAHEAVAARDSGPVVLERARDLERAVHASASARLPERAGFARDLAHAAFADYVWRASGRDSAANPVTPLTKLWKTGYVLASADASGATLVIPPL